MSKMRKEKYDIISEFDKARWGKNRVLSSYNSINMVKRRYSNDEKLLIHWISYITNRQIPYKKVFDIGGFVFSNLIYYYYQKKNKASSLLKINSSSNAFVGKIEKSYYFISRANANDIIKNYDSTYKKKAKYSPRFIGPDYKSIAMTLRILESKDYNRSFAKYISTIIEAVYKDKNSKGNRTEEYVEAIAKGLNLLTYHEIGQPKANKSGLNRVYREIFISDNFINKRKDEINKWLEKPCEDDLSDKVKYGASKRLWCSIRDFIKSPEYSEYFSKALKANIKNKKIFEDFKKNVLKDNKGCRYVELPGDVWNNNTIFRKCFGDKKQKEKLGKVLRDVWKESDDWYPEQFDTTFDLAPKMCEQGKCNICLLNDKRKTKELKLYCANSKGKFCPLLMLHCGYKYKCPGKNNCKLQKLI